MVQQQLKSSVSSLIFSDFISIAPRSLSTDWNLSSSSGIIIQSDGSSVLSYIFSLIGLAVAVEIFRTSSPPVSISGIGSPIWDKSISISSQSSNIFSINLLFWRSLPDEILEIISPSALQLLDIFRVGLQLPDRFNTFSLDIPTSTALSSKIFENL